MTEAGAVARRHPRLARVMAVLRRPAVATATRIVVAVAVVGLVVWFVMVPQFQADEADLTRVLSISPVLLATAVAGETCSLLSFSILTTVLLGRGVPFRRLVAIDLADLAVNHTVPGGGAVAAAIRYRLLRAEGVAGRRAVSIAAIETVLSNLALGLLFLVGVVLSLGSGSPSATVWIAAAVMVVLSAAVGVLFWALMRRTPSLLRVARRVERVLHLRAGRLEGLVREGARVVGTIVHDRRLALRASVAAMANWLLDAATLWVVLGAMGAWVDPRALLLAYGLAQLLGQLPITPGGLGIVEATAILTLTAAGVPHGVALLGVLGWRILEYWIPVPIGWACYLVLRVAAPRRAQAPAGRAPAAPAPASPAPAPPEGARSRRRTARGASRAGR